MWMHVLNPGWAWPLVILIWLIWTLLVFGIGWGMAYQLRRNSHDHRHGFHHEETPLEILKRRYAKGEITKEEFEQMTRDIGNSKP
jgi:putative membrane protein